MSGESSNPNIPVTESLTTPKNEGGAIDASGGPLTFDELDHAISQKKVNNKKNTDLTSDDKKGKSESKKSEEKSEKKDEKAAKSEDKQDSKTDKKSTEDDKQAKQDSEKPPRKTVKAKYEDSEIEIDEDALIPVPVNGEIQMWSLKDLRQQQSGKVAYDKKFQELDKERQSVRTDKQKLEHSAKAIKDAMEEGDPHLKIYKIAKIAGADPVQFRKQWMDDQLKYLESYQAMNQDERNADDRAYEAKIYKHRADTLERAASEQQATQALSQKIDQVRASHQIGEDEFFNKFDELEAKVKLGKWDPKNLTPETIVETIIIDRLWAPAAKSLDALGLEMTQEERGRTISKIVQSAMSIGLKPEDIPGIIDEVYGVKKAKSKVEQKQKENEEFMTGKKPVEVRGTSKVSEPTFFNEM